MSEANHDAASRPMNRIVTRDDLGGNESEIAALPEPVDVDEFLVRFYENLVWVEKHGSEFSDKFNEGYTAGFRAACETAEELIDELRHGSATMGEPPRRLG